MSTTPEERSLRAQIAAFERWAYEADRSDATAAARAASMGRFDKLVDPDGSLTPEERARRAACARKAHFLRMALRSAQARRARKNGEAA
ncbi:hypothetical protein GCM10022403_087320 [Streptomyces coacervatus]|uniref:Uncharacterized protein n=1 Tax=Streptomyces coacervatus TaxID=647381 RepID=A0ABP7JD20_9ACTN|nr:hypothetical protein [Streptomyces coacervatus]MDF2273394.1 hypothetical protein [Streptomyces coacervatus]